MANQNIAALRSQTERLVAEAEAMSKEATNQLNVLKERVKQNRPLMERVHRQFKGAPSLLWENLKP